MKRVIPLVVITIGLALSLLNLLGSTLSPLADGQSVTRGDAAIPGYHFPSRSVDELQNMLHTPTPAFDLERVNNTVFESLAHADDRRIAPHENWLLWLAGLLYEPASKTQNAARIVSGGKAICSEAAMVVNEIARLNGIDARLVALNGHVVSEVRTDNGWQVADPDYGVVFAADTATLEAGHLASAMRAKLRQRGFSDTTIERYVEFFHSSHDNRVLDVGSPSSPRLHAFEQIAEWLKWLVPGLLISAGLIAMRASRTRVSSKRCSYC